MAWEQYISFAKFLSNTHTITSQEIPLYVSHFAWTLSTL